MTGSTPARKAANAWPRVPAQVGGRYRIEERIAGGGMAEVFRATDERTGTLVAVKILRAEAAERERVVERLKREAEILSQVQNPAVVGILDCGVAENLGVFLVLEFVRGQTLLEYIRERAPIAPADLVVLVDGIAEGLDAVHAHQIVHRDLKPSNVILADDGDTAVKIIDFGVSKAIGLERLTVTGELVGTPRFMAPEQLRDARNVDGRADTYALGLSLYIALSAKLPFEGSAGEMLAQILRGRIDPLLEVSATPLSAAIGQVIHRAISLNPDDRYRTAGELAADFRAAAGTSDSSTRAITVAFDPEQLAEMAHTRASQLPPQRFSGPAPASARPSSIPHPAAPKRSGCALWAVLGITCLVFSSLLVAVGAAAFSGWSPSALWGPRESPDLPPPPLESPDEPEERRELVLSTSPPAAMVKEDGITIGSTPLTLLAPAAGEQRTFSIELPEYDPVEIRLNQQSEDLQVTLSPTQNAETETSPAQNTSPAGRNASHAHPHHHPTADDDPQVGRAPEAIVCPWCNSTTCEHTQH